MASKPSEYEAFLPNTLLTVVNSKSFIPFQLATADPSIDGVSLAALAASQHQRHDQLLALPASTPLSDALSFFRRWDITAVPLLDDAVLKAKKKKKFSPNDVVGLFTMQDLTRPLVCHPIFERAPPSLLPHLLPVSASASPSASSSAPRAGVALGESDFLAQLHSLDVWSAPASSFMSCNRSNRAQWFLEGTRTVEDAARALSSGLRHVLVTEGSDINAASPVTIHMLSAGDLARFVWTSLPQDVSENSTLPPALSRLLASKVGSHLSGAHTVVTFTEHEPTINAFRRLASAASPSSSPLGAVPIVNSSAMVVDNLSATDLRLLTPSTFRHILDPLSSFLRTLRSAPPSASTSPQPSPASSSASASSAVKSLRPPFAATVTREASLQMLLEKMVNLGISRVWVVDEGAKAVGVIALSDVFRMIVALKMDDRGR